MSEWRRASTPTHIFKTNISLVGSTVFVTYAQNGRTVVEKTGTELTITDEEVFCTLTQAETLRFRPGEVQIQIRYVAEDGSADASNIIAAQAEEILKEGEIRYV